jgi:peptidoglycan hydrolase-like protein with peptidoglycan-binding domain
VFAPLTVGALTASTTGPTSIDLSWPTASGGVSPILYTLLRDGLASPIGTTSTLTFTDIGRAPSTTYAYELRAEDAIGNLSTATTAITTLPDTTAPTAPGDPTALPLSDSAISLTWPASSDDVGVATYQIFRNGTVTPIAAVSGATLTFTDSGLAPLSPFTYQIAAVDGSGNISLFSATTSATTLAVPPSPPPATSPQTGGSGGGGGGGIVRIQQYRTGGVTINQGAETTNSGSVTLALNAPGSLFVALSNSPTYAGSVFIPYTPSVQWILSATGTPTRTVYAKFQDATGGLTEAIDTIRYEQSGTPSQGGAGTEGEVLGASIRLFASDLRQGMRGDDITELQRRLISLGHLSVAPTGYFGTLTHNGVRAYQRSRGLPDTGYVGPLTRGALNDQSIALAAPSQGDRTLTIAQLDDRIASARASLEALLASLRE